MRYTLTHSHELHKLFTLYRAAGCLRYSTTSMPNMAFTAGTIFLLSSVQNERSTREIAQALAKVNDCAGFLAEMAWPVAAVAKDVLIRLRKEWATTRPSRPGTPGPSSMTTIAALQDPDSDMYRMLKDLGWAPPMNAAVPEVIPSGGVSDTATDLTATLFAPTQGEGEDDRECHGWRQADPQYSASGRSSGRISQVPTFQAHSYACLDLLAHPITLHVQYQHEPRRVTHGPLWDL